MNAQDLVKKSKKGDISALKCFWVFIGCYNIYYINSNLITPPESNKNNTIP
jgi:hypothetical protein